MSPVHLPGDVENGIPTSSPLTQAPSQPTPCAGGGDSTDGPKSLLQRFEHQLVVYNFEERGIRRVLPNERHDLQHLGLQQVGLLWFSINLAANNITLGLLGPILFELSFKDASFCAVFGMLLGSAPVAYIATFGPRSGSRSLVVARYAMGWWPSKIIVVLNIVVLLGYAMIDAVVAGQLLSAVSPNESLSVVVGIIIVSIITWIITLFGYNVVHMYERYAWISQLIVFSILAGVAGPSFDLETPTTGDYRTRIGNRLSFFSLCFSAAITYSGIAADLFVYYPEKTPRRKIFSATMVGLMFSFAYALILGIGLGTGTATNAAWSEAYSISQGALIVEGFRPLGTFGSVCSVIIALGLIGNIIPPIYGSGVDFQILSSLCQRIPRVIWNSFGVIIFMVCALAGRDHLAAIFTNFLALMGYWVSIWIAIMLEEQFIFRRRRGYDFTQWDQQKYMPIGIAALVAFLVGWAGAILSMAQYWYIGPFAKQLGDFGGDMGNYVGFAWAALVFPPLRYWELKRFGR